MKPAQETTDKKRIFVRIDKSLNHYDDKILFPEKVERARQTIERIGLPGQPKKNNP